MTVPASPPPETDSRPNALNRFLLGATPPAIATFAALWQLLAPYTTSQHRGFLYVAVLIAYLWPLTVWIGCKVDHVAAKFAKSDQAAAALAQERHRRILALIEERHQLAVELAEERHQHTIEVMEERHRRTLERIERLSSEMFVFIEGVETKLDAILEKVECNERSLKGLHRHLDQTDNTIEEITKEVEHLRKLVLGVDEIPTPRQGPRPLP
jgi:hypothetical protein